MNMMILMKMIIKNMMRLFLIMYLHFCPQQGETFSSGVGGIEEKEGTIYSIHCMPLISKDAKPIENKRIWRL